VKVQVKSWYDGLMMDIKSLTRSINTALQTMDDEYAAAKKLMGVKPSLDEAARHVQEANMRLHELAELILRAQNFCGIRQPPDVVKRINARHDEILELANEITMCNAVVQAQATRPTSGKFGVN
jgi:hypothetical protein